MQMPCITSVHVSEDFCVHVHRGTASRSTSACVCVCVFVCRHVRASACVHDSVCECIRAPCLRISAPVQRTLSLNVFVCRLCVSTALMRANGPKQVLQPSVPISNNHGTFVWGTYLQLDACTPGFVSQRVCVYVCAQANTGEEECEACTELLCCSVAT